MSIENSDTNISTNDAAVEDVSLDSFEAEFFSGKAPAEKPTEEVVETESETNDEPTVEDEVVTETTTDEDETSTEITEEEDEPKKETRAEKRIRELNAKFREAERRAEEAERRAEEAERNRKPVEESKEQKPVTTDTGPKAPHWDDEDSEGNKIYPLGQFDPKFNADLVRYTIQEENKRLEEQRTQTEAQRKAAEAERVVQQAWEEKRAPARERYPDFQERGEELINQFSDLEPNYAKYLTDTLRTIDNGPDVLYYLASNPDLADEIVRKGAATATIAFGRISAQLEKDAPSNTTPTRTKVTNAPPPPPKARGTAPPKTKNLDDLDDFESVFFSR